MVIQCPHKGNSDWIALVAKVGEIQAYKEYIKNGNEIPTLDQLKDIQKEPETIDYNLKSVNILSSDKAKQIFEKGSKSKWNLDKILTELQIPKEQKQLILDSEATNREEALINLLANYSYTVQIKVAIQNKDSNEFENTYPEEYLVDPETNITYIPPKEPTQYYSNLTVPGGANYTENEISTPAITPSIKGHAQFSTDNGIGWFRSDDQINNRIEKLEKLSSNIDIDNIINNATTNEIRRLKELGYVDNKIVKEGNLTKSRRILEVQSDLFQKGRDKNELSEGLEKSKDGFGRNFKGYKEQAKENNFLQLLNKDQNWVKFFIKSIIQKTTKETIQEINEEDVENKVRELQMEGKLKINCD